MHRRRSLYARAWARAGSRPVESWPPNAMPAERSLRYTDVPVATVTEQPAVRETREGGSASQWAEGDAAPSPAGPVEPDHRIRMPPARALPKFLQTVRFGMRPLGFSLEARRELGDGWQVQLTSRLEPI